MQVVERLAAVGRGRTDAGELGTQMAQKLRPPATARTLRTRNGQPRITDGPFAETREILAGFNLIEAADAEEAMRIARQFPWAAYGSIEVREVEDLQAERARLDA